ncbi:MAG: nucleotidyltransferase domain-containing protein [Mariprofundaceae bacterium]|nr:nucleotidyltransferase domain-containing protein [Mariprofundaceae bacterium]
MTTINQAFSVLATIEKVVLYGSRAKGNYRKGSDIDITLIGENLTLNNSVYPLMEMFDASDLPYSFDVSILKEIESTDLLEHIQRVGKVLYERK